MMRRRTRHVAILGVLLIGSTLTAAGATPEESADVAVQRALCWLVEQQNADGSFTASVGFKLNKGYQIESDERPHVPSTALAGLALLAAGDDACEAIRSARQRAAAYLVGCAHPVDGYISRDGSRMYGHALATLFLAEADGRIEVPGLVARMKLAVKLLVETQNEEGGWRYRPFTPESDISVTACVLEALAAARVKNFAVPEETLERAQALLERLFVTTEHDFVLHDDYYLLRRGCFTYQPRESTRSSFALTAAGLSATQSCGWFPAGWSASVEILDQHYESTRGYEDHYFYWYSHFHAVQALCEVGGEAWKKYQERIRTDLLDRLTDVGNWKNDIGPGDVFATAIACLVLQADNGHLSIFRSSW